MYQVTLKYADENIGLGQGETISEAHDKALDSMPELFMFVLRDIAVEVKSICGFVKAVKLAVEFGGLSGIPMDHFWPIQMSGKLRAKHLIAESIESTNMRLLVVNRK